MFQAYVRTPASALTHLHKLTVPGLFFEPRSAEGSGPHPHFAVVWIPGADASVAAHALRTCDKALAVVRLGMRFGVRVRESEEEAAFQALRPNHQFIKVKVVAKFRYGCQRHSLVQILQNWKWEAKPLQPDKGSADGAAWIVGASSDPPSPAMPLGDGHVLVTKVPVNAPVKQRVPHVTASSRTLRHIKYDDPVDTSTGAATPFDPWMGGNDPWAEARAHRDALPPPGLPPPKSVAQPASLAKFEQLQADLKKDLQSIVQAELAGHPAALSVRTTVLPNSKSGSRRCRFRMANLKDGLLVLAARFRRRRVSSKGLKSP